MSVSFGDRRNVNQVSFLSSEAQTVLVSNIRAVWHNLIQAGLVQTDSLGEINRVMLNLDTSLICSRSGESYVAVYVAPGLDLNLKFEMKRELNGAWGAEFRMSAKAFAAAGGLADLVAAAGKEVASETEQVNKIRSAAYMHCMLLQVTYLTTAQVDVERAINKGTTRSKSLPTPQAIAASKAVLQRGLSMAAVAVEKQNNFVTAQHLLVTYRTS